MFDVMHDGSRATLEDVLDHYERRVIARPSLSTDLPQIRLTPDERQDLLAVLATLSSETAPVPSALDTESAPTIPTPETARQVRQKNKQFSPAAIRLPRGEPLMIVNDDTRTHNVRWDGDGAFNSGAQEPGQTVTVTLPGTGIFQIYCGIHPAMRLTVDIPPP